MASIIMAAPNAASEQSTDDTAGRLALRLVQLRGLLATSLNFSAFPLSEITSETRNSHLRACAAIADECESLVSRL